MTLLDAATALLAAGFAPGDVLDLDELGAMVVQACDPDAPTAEPSGEACIVEVSVIWHLESRHAVYPAARGHGCGPLQCLPGRLHNSRIGTVWTPPCETLPIVLT